MSQYIDLKPFLLCIIILASIDGAAQEIYHPLINPTLAIERNYDYDALLQEIESAPDKISVDHFSRINLLAHYLLKARQFPQLIEILKPVIEQSGEDEVWHAEFLFEMALARIGLNDFAQANDLLRSHYNLSRHGRITR